MSFKAKPCPFRTMGLTPQYVSRENEEAFQQILTESLELQLFKLYNTTSNDTDDEVLLQNQLEVLNEAYEILQLRDIRSLFCTHNTELELQLAWFQVKELQEFKGKTTSERIATTTDSSSADSVTLRNQRMQAYLDRSKQNRWLSERYQNTAQSARKDAKSIGPPGQSTSTDDQEHITEKKKESLEGKLKHESCTADKQVTKKQTKKIPKKEKKESQKLASTKVNESIKFAQEQEKSKLRSENNQDQGFAWKGETLPNRSNRSEFDLEGWRKKILLRNSDLEALVEAKLLSLKCQQGPLGTNQLHQYPVDLSKNDESLEINETWSDFDEDFYDPDEAFPGDHCLDGQRKILEREGGVSNADSVNEISANVLHVMAENKMEADAALKQEAENADEEARPNDKKSFRNNQNGKCCLV